MTEPNRASPLRGDPLTDQIDPDAPLPALPPPPNASEKATGPKPNDNLDQVAADHTTVYP